MPNTHWRDEETLEFGVNRDVTLKRSGAGKLTVPSLTGKRFDSHVGTALASTDFAASAGWGTTPTITMVGGTDQAASLTVLAQATTGANPTLTLTFKDGTWTNAPVVVACRTDNAVAPTTCYWAVTSVTATAAVFTFVGTPTAGNTYGLAFEVFGT